MNFSTADRVSSVIEDLKNAEILRAPNRALINDLYNGVPPYTKQEEGENHILVNVNWKEGTNLLHQARRQYENAFLKPGVYFNIHLEEGPISKRRDWSRAITRNLNRPLKRSLQFMEAYRSKFAGVVLHGVGPMAWEDEWKWMPYTFGIEDLLIPTDTYTTLENLSYFAIRKSMKPGELFRKTFGLDDKTRDPGWDLKTVRTILDSFKDLNQNPQQWNWSEHPEKMAEIYKQNLTYYDSDSAPVIWFWDFYFQEEEDQEGRWNRRLMLDRDHYQGGMTSVTSPITFIYQKDSFAGTLDEILHLQFGDGNNKPPFMYHSCRSIGYLLYDVVHMMNRLRCQFTEHVFEQMMMLLRVQDPNDRARVEKLLLNNKGIMPEGASIIPAAERYSIDKELVNMLMSENRQLMSESTAAYTQDIDKGTQQEKTATQVMAEVNSVNALTTSLINYAYLRENFAYREIARRFCIKDSPEKAVKKFRADCINDGVPEKYLDVEMWEIESERVLGGGNKILEVAQAKELLSMRPTLDPDAQREVSRIAIGAFTDDEKLADRLVPENPQKVSDARHDAELAFGTLMQGVPMGVRSGYNQRDQIETFLRLMTGVIKRIMQTGGVGTQQEVIGLQTVAQHVEQHIQILSEDKTEKQRVHQYQKVLMKLMNLVKAMAQRQQEMQKKAQEQQQQDPAAAAKIQMDAMSNKVKLAGKQQADQQKLRHKEIAFQQQQQHKQIETQSGLQRQNAETTSKIYNSSMEAAARAKQATRATEDE